MEIIRLIIDVLSFYQFHVVPSNSNIWHSSWLSHGTHRLYHFIPHDIFSNWHSMSLGMHCYNYLGWHMLQYYVPQWLCRVMSFIIVYIALQHSWMMVLHDNVYEILHHIATFINGYVAIRHPSQFMSYCNIHQWLCFITTFIKDYIHYVTLGC